MTANLPQPHDFYSRDLRLRYHDWGNADAPLMLLVHGGMEHGRAWDEMASALRADWHVVAIDLRGHGTSEWCRGGSYASLDYVPDLLALLDHLGAAEAVLMGHSLGGNIAVHFAALYPERVSRLCIIEGLGLSPAAREKRDQDSRIAQMRAWVDRSAAPRSATRIFPDVETAARRLMQHDPLLPPATAHHLALHGLRQTEGGWTWKCDSSSRRRGPSDIASPPMNDIFAAIPCPVLLIYGRESWASNPEKDGRAAHFHNARTLLVDRAGHNVHHHQPGVVLAALAEFLR